jgi:hypothetical protein
VLPDPPETPWPGAEVCHVVLPTHGVVGRSAPAANPDWQPRRGPLLAGWKYRGREPDDLDTTLKEFDKELLMLIAHVELACGRPAGARPSLERILREHPTSHLRARAHKLLAGIESRDDSGKEQD